MAQPQSTYFTYATVHGPITIRATKRGVAEIAFEQTTLEGTCAASEITNTAATQIQEYLAGKRHTFNVPIDAAGTAFQQTVWTEVCAVPYGETRTAAEIAEALGKPGSHRSVGTAIRQNKLAPIIPTHRIPVANATGRQAKIMRALLALEQRNG
ncbi:MAG: methylated-DNA--[Eggerthellaceae bacterium]|nr:methylated-DNA--[protein]-cysteine S-methyltransferase [Eggerthellaceae bacterium]